MYERHKTMDYFGGPFPRERNKGYGRVLNPIGR